MNTHRLCSPGQRARDKKTGRIVLVVDYYVRGETWGGVSDWIACDRPWKVLSLGRPYDLYYLNEGVEESFVKSSPYCVVEDARLVPLDDHDDGLTRCTSKTRPAAKPRAGKSLEVTA